MKYEVHTFIFIEISNAEYNQRTLNLKDFLLIKVSEKLLTTVILRSVGPLKQINPNYNSLSCFEDCIALFNLMITAIFEIFRKTQNLHFSMFRVFF